MLSIKFTTPLNLAFLLFLLLNIPSANAGFSLVASNSETGQIGLVGASCASISGPQDWFFLLRFSLERIILNNLIFLENSMNISTPHKIDYDFYGRRGVLLEHDVGKLVPDIENPSKSKILTTSHGENDRFQVIATGSEVLDGTIQALHDGFSNTTASPFVGDNNDLAGRLMTAFDAVVENGLGDPECNASSAFLYVVNSDATVPVGFHGHRVEEMEGAFLEWRNGVTNKPESKHVRDVTDMKLLAAFLCIWIAGQFLPPLLQVMLLHMITVNFQICVVELQILQRILLCCCHALAVHVYIEWVKLRVHLIRLQLLRLQLVMRLKGYVLFHVELTIFDRQFSIWLLLTGAMDMLGLRWVFLRRGRFGRLRMMIPILQNLWFAVVQRIKSM